MRSLLDAPVGLSFGGKPAWRAHLDERPVLLMVGGMGKTNAAHGLTSILEHERPAGVIGFGVGGAYPGSGLAVGEVAIATEEIYGDEGVEAPDGWQSTEGIGIPLLVLAGQSWFNRIPLAAELVPGVVATIRKSGSIVEAGPFVTVSSCSGTAARGGELATRFGAICETMEGAAYAHVAALYNIPYLGIRGISNLVEDRDLSAWRLSAAAAAGAQAAALACRAFWSPQPE